MKFLPMLFTAAVLLPAQAVLFDTDLVKVIKVSEKPGPKGNLHKHDVNRVMVYLDAGHMKLNYEDGKVDDRSEERRVGKECRL